MSHPIFYLLHCIWAFALFLYIPYISLCKLNNTYALNQKNLGSIWINFQDLGKVGRPLVMEGKHQFSLPQTGSHLHPTITIGDCRCLGQTLSGIMLTCRRRTNPCVGGLLDFQRNLAATSCLSRRTDDKVLLPKDCCRSWRSLLGRQTGCTIKEEDLSWSTISLP